VGTQSTQPLYVKPEYPQSDLTGRIIAAAQRVHRTLGPGFEETIYQRALALELTRATLDFSREVWVDVHYEDTVVGHKRVDFIVEDIMVETKAKVQLDDVDVVQTLSYLRASGYPIGLLLNFGGKKLEIKRLVHTRREP
jgi:GxxExxY protein